MTDSPTPKPPSSPTILLVDDNALTRMLNARILQKEGIQHLEAVDGQEALNTYKDTPGIDCILMDLDMPVMDGFDSIRAIRKWEKEHRTPPCPILVLTAQRTEEDEAASMDAGADGFLSKPTSRDILINAIHQQLKSH